MTEYRHTEHALTEIAAAKKEHREANLHCAELRGANLSGANLRGANLHCADLRNTNLRGADLRGSDLRCANLYGANLYAAKLRGANLYGAYLNGANLHRADLHGLIMDGLPSGALTFIPTTVGWHLSIGCWSGDITELRTMLDGDDHDWPEARGEERTRRESILRPVLAMCEAYAAAHPTAIEEVTAAAERQSNTDKETPND